MTITLSVIELLTIVQLGIIQLLEGYCIEKCNELRFEHYFNTYIEVNEVTSLYSVEDFGIEKHAYQSKEDCSQPVEVFELSSIEGTGAEELFLTIQQELQIPEGNTQEPVTFADDYQHNTDEDYNLMQQEDPFFANLVDEQPINQNDFLSISDLQQVEKENQVVSSEYSKLATAKIADNTLGLQQWTVNVIGRERQFVHVSDGSRIWLDLGKYVHDIRNGDVLSVDVERTSEQVRVVNATLLHSVSEEYLIPDEMEYLEESESVAI